MKTVQEVIERIKSAGHCYAQLDGAHFASVVSGLESLGFAQDLTAGQTFTMGRQAYLSSKELKLRVEVIQANCLGTFTEISCRVEK